MNSNAITNNTTKQLVTKKAHILTEIIRPTIVVLKKHEEQIRNLQVKADKAKAWKIENEQLREEIKERNLNYEER